MADFTQQQQQYIAHAYPAPLNGNMMYGNVMDPSIACRPSMYHQQQQFNFQFASGHIQPQHHQQARRLQLLQQQQAMYQQQLMEYQQRQQQFEHQQQQHQLGSPGKRFQTKAEKRAEHNAIERARRENLNTKFQQLAHSLPNLQNDRRPSKGTIIERTLDYVKQTVQKEERLIREIRRLREENEELMQQLYSTGERTDQNSLKSCPSLVMTQEGASSVGGDLDSNSLLGSSWEVMFQNSSQAAPLPGSSSTSPVGFDSDDDNSSTNADDLDLNNAAAISTSASFANMPTEFIGKLTSTPSNTEFKVQSQQN